MVFAVHLLTGVDHFPLTVPFIRVHMEVPTNIGSGIRTSFYQPPVGGEVIGGEVIGGEVIGGEVIGGEVIGGEVIGGEVIVYKIEPCCSVFIIIDSESYKDHVDSEIHQQTVGIDGNTQMGSRSGDTSTVICPYVPQ